MYAERAVMGGIMLALAAACAWGARKAFIGRSAGNGRALAGGAAALGAILFGWWAVNLLTV